MSVEKTKCRKPPEHIQVMNSVVQSDAAWLESTNNAGLAWILKSERQTKEDSRGVSFVSSTLIAEGLAMREAVDACRREGVKTVRFESD